MPAPGEHQLLLHVRAVAPQRGEIELVESLDADAKGPDRSGMIICSDAAGDVVAVGPKVRGVRVGDKVTSLYLANYVEPPLDAEKQKRAYGYSENGVLGEYVLLDDTGVAPMPRGYSYVEAAAMPTSSITAWMATVGQGYMRSGDTVLVEGTGGVSVFALQFAHAAGARVIVTSSTEDKLAKARELGATEGINYRGTPDWSARVLELTHDRGADLVVDVGGKSTIEQSVKSVAYAGTIALVGGLGGYQTTMPTEPLILHAASARGVYTGSRADYLRMLRFVEHHRIHPVIARTYGLEDYVSAMRDLAAGNFVGKLVITLP